MAPKHRGTREPTPAAAAVSQASSTTPGNAPPVPKASKSASVAQSQNWDKVIANIYNHYLESTPQRTKLIDVFMAFLAVVGALQFLYCVLAGNYVCYSLVRGSGSMTTNS
jgi:oligosaccharyltransferase complex subunit epsilon